MSVLGRAVEGENLPPGHAFRGPRPASDEPAPPRGARCATVITTRSHPFDLAATCGGRTRRSFADSYRMSCPACRRSRALRRRRRYRWANQTMAADTEQIDVSYRDTS